MASVSEIQSKNPLLFLIGIVAAIMFLMAKPLQAAFGGASSRQRRALARARAAKRRKGRKRRR
jgi:hypothetical protein